MQFGRGCDPLMGCKKTELFNFTLFLPPEIVGIPKGLCSKMSRDGLSRENVHPSKVSNR